MKSKVFHIPYGSIPVPPAEPIACRNGWIGNDGTEEAFFSAVWNEAVIIVRFLTRKAPIVCRNFADMASVSDDSCVEVFLRPEEDGEYWNLEFNIAEFINASHRLVRNAKTPLTPEECAAVVRRSTIRVVSPEEGNRRDEWGFEVHVPWRILGVEPRKGMRMTGNFYACAGKADIPYYLSWAPIATEKPDFHRPDFFVEIVLD